MGFKSRCIEISLFPHFSLLTCVLWGAQGSLTNLGSACPDLGAQSARLSSDKLPRHEILVSSSISSLLTSSFTSYSTVAPLVPPEAELSAGSSLAIHLGAPVG